VGRPGPLGERGEGCEAVVAGRGDGGVELVESALAVAALVLAHVLGVASHGGAKPHEPRVGDGDAPLVAVFGGGDPLLGPAADRLLDGPGGARVRPIVCIGEVVRAHEPVPPDPRGELDLLGPAVVLVAELLPRESGVVPRRRRGRCDDLLGAVGGGAADEQQAGRREREPAATVTFPQRQRPGRRFRCDDARDEAFVLFLCRLRHGRGRVDGGEAVQDVSTHRGASFRCR